MIFVLKTLVTVIGLAIAETNFTKAIDIAGIRPDLMVLAVVVATTRADFGKAIILAFMLGLARDFLSGGTVGMNAFSLALVTYLLVVIKEYLMIGNRSTQIFFAFLGSVFFGVSTASLKTILHYEFGSTLQILWLILGTSVYTAVFAPIAFILTERPAYLPYMRLRLRQFVERETIPEIRT